jgi:predicted lysophospholipase L1 biosynthesis ABC-type transport system permease subunit
MPVEPPTRELERRQQVAVDLLKSLGLLRRQVSSITAWQVSTLAVLVLPAGVLLAVAAGRWGWGLFAAGRGICGPAP